MKISTEYVLECMSEIDNVVNESCLETCTAMYDAYDKILTIQEYYSDNEIIQEGKILDAATGKGKSESAIVKIVKFLPRLLIAIAQSIKSSIKGEDYNVNEYKKVQKMVDTASPEMVENLANVIKKDSDGKITLDPKTKRYRVLGIGGLWNKAWLLTNASTVLRNTKHFLSGEDADLNNLKNEISKIINKEKEIDSETKDLTLDALAQLALAGVPAAGLVADGCKEAAGLINNKIIDEFEKGDGQNTEKLGKLEDCLRGIKKIARIVQVTGLGFGLIRKAKSATKQVMQGGDFDFDDMDAKFDPNIIDGVAKTAPDEDETED